MTTGFNKKFLVVIIGLIVVGVVGLSYLRKPVTSEPIVASEKIDDWKTYTNTKYGFTMKYPDTLTPVETPDDVIYLHRVEFQVPKVTSISGITVEVRNFTTLEDEIVYRKWTVEGHLIPGKIDSEEPITVSDLPGRMLNYTSGEEKFSIAIVPYQGFVYSIKAPSNQLELYNQIISSFKFLDTSKNTISVKLYYHDPKLDPNTENCESKDYVEKEIIKTDNPIKDTINALISSDVFKKDDKFVLKSINLKQDGTLLLEFPFIGGFTTGGSCWIGILTSQIKNTALQFSEVKKVIFEPNVFQP